MRTAFKQQRNVRQKRPKMVSSQQNGSKGGRATSRNHGQAFKEGRARAGGQATLQAYGREYYSYLAKRMWAKRRKAGR